MDYSIGTYVFGDWRIVRDIGQGSFGYVYELKKNQYDVTAHSALKVIRIPTTKGELDEAISEMGTKEEAVAYFEEYVSQMVKEISIMNSLKGNPHIVTCEDYTVVSSPEKTQWEILIRMELLTPLDQYIQKQGGKLDEQTVIRLGKELSTALAVCEEKKIIHRDIKPANIFVTEDGSFKLGDFGVARTLEQTTKSYSKKGTQVYMAPEILADKKYNSTVDLYSLGLVMYRLVNRNRMPFLPLTAGPIKMTEREEAFVKRYRGEPFPDPAEASAALTYVIKKACAFDPQKRYQTADDMKTDLDNLSLLPHMTINEDDAKTFVDRSVLEKHIALKKEERATSIAADDEKTYAGTSERKQRSEKNLPVKEEIVYDFSVDQKKTKLKKGTVIALIIAVLAIAACVIYAVLRTSDDSIKKESSDDRTAAVDTAVEESEEAVKETIEETATEEAAVEKITEDTAPEEAAEEAAEETATEEAAVEKTTEETAPEEATEAASGYVSALYPDGEGVFYKASSYNEAAPDWTEYTDLIAQIKNETDTEVRAALMHKAEDILMGTGAVIPIFYYNDLYLQKTDVEGIYSNLFGFKFFQFADSRRDVLKVNLSGEPFTIDPALNSSIDGSSLDVNLFAGLYTYDAEGALQPDLADPANPYEVSEDGTVYTFHLLDGIKWSDGSDVTARDFEYAWKRCADPMTVADYAYMFDCFALNGDGSIMVEAIDDKTLVATLNAPCAYFLDLCAFPAYLPVPQSQVEAQSDWEINPGAWCAEAGFVTNGAYTVKEWKHEESMVFVKNPNYHRADEVSIEEIDFMLSADDTAIYAAYQSDDLDFADTVPTNEIANIKGNDDFHVVDNLGTYYAAFNVNSPIFEGKTVDQAVAMRKAFSLLIDRQYIVDTIGQTEQKVASSYIPAGMADGNGSVFKKNTDAYTFPYAETKGYYPLYENGVEDEAIEEARALLAYAGYEFTEDGVLSDKTPINITYLTNESIGHEAIAKSMQGDFDILGIKMSIETCEWNVFLDERRNGNFDIAREGWLADYNDPINMLEMWTPQSGNNDCQFGKDPHSTTE